MFFSRCCPWRARPKLVHTHTGICFRWAQSVSDSRLVTAYGRVPLCNNSRAAHVLLCVLFLFLVLLTPPAGAKWELEKELCVGMFERCLNQCQCMMNISHVSRHDTMSLLMSSSLTIRIYECCHKSRCRIRFVLTIYNKEDVSSFFLFFL